MEVPYLQATALKNIKVFSNAKAERGDYDVYYVKHKKNILISNDSML